MLVAIVATVILGFAGEAMYKTWLDSQREKKMLSAFDKPPAPADPIFVERPLVYEMVITRGDYGYGVIVKNHGTGKSTIVERIACETSGVPHISIKLDPNIEKELPRAIISTLPPISFLGKI